MRISALLIALVALISSARATQYINGGDGIGLRPGFAQRDPMVIGTEGVLILTAPGTYTAASWSISGEVRLAVPGNYIIVASAGPIALNRTAKVRGPAGAVGNVAQLTFSYSGEVIPFLGEIDPTVGVRTGVAPPIDSPPLVNISTRATLGAGETHTSGFVIGGRVSRRVLIRAVGPTLATFGVTNTLATPVLTIFNRQGFLMTNSGWDVRLEAVFFIVGAFRLSANSRDAATFLTLDPGSYTVQVGGGAGEMLLEIYHVD